MISAYEVEASLLQAKSFPPLERARSGQLDDDASYFGIRHDGRLVAAAAIESIIAGRDVITATVVCPEYFRIGLGEKLLRYAIARCGARCIQVSTAWDNLPARKLYCKVGFRHCARWLTSDGFSMVTLSLDNSGAE